MDQEVCDALPVGYWLVGTPTFGVATSEYGRDYRLGPQLHRGAVSFESGRDAQCRESSATDGCSTDVFGRISDLSRFSITSPFLHQPVAAPPRTSGRCRPVRSPRFDDLAWKIRLLDRPVPENPLESRVAMAATSGPRWRTWHVVRHKVEAAHMHGPVRAPTEWETGRPTSINSRTQPPACTAEQGR